MMALDLALALDPARVMIAAGLTPDPWQAELLRSESKRDLLLCYRQAGKSTATAALSIWTAIYDAPALILLLSPSLRQSKELFRKVVEFHAALGSPMQDGPPGVLEMKLANGSRIIALPDSEETIRGFSNVRLIVIDEASRASDALYFSVRPMLLMSGGRLILLSTPYGKRGFFFDQWTGESDQWKRHTITAYDCPRVDPAFLAEEKASMPASMFGQEYLCEFNETDDQVFSYADVMDALSDTANTLELTVW